MVSHRRGRPRPWERGGGGTEVGGPGPQETGLNSSLGWDPLHPPCSTFGIQIVFAGVVHGFCEDPWGFPAHSTLAPVPLPPPPPFPPPPPPPPPPPRPGNPAGAELRPAAHSDPITAATVRLSLEAAPGSLARVSTAGLQPASPLPGVGRFPKGSGFSPCSVNMSGRESWEVWALHTAHTCPCNTRAPTQTHILHIHVYTHTRAHSRTEKHICKRVHGPSWPGQCWGNAGLAVYGTNP